MPFSSFSGGWQTYRDQGYGFTIRYPSSLKLSTTPAAIEAGSRSMFPVCGADSIACLEYNGDAFDKTEFQSTGISVNILRDLPADLKKGRCYLPKEKLERYKLSPQTLLSPATETKFLPLFHEYLDKAQEHLQAGWNYTNTLPFSQLRVRLACAWPILIGMKTIEKLRTANVI